MKFFLKASLVCFLCTPLLVGCAGDPDAALSATEGNVMTGKVTESPHVAGQLMIRFKDSIEPSRAEEILELEGAQILTRYSDLRMFHIGLPKDMTVKQGTQRFQQYSETDFVEANQIYTTQEPQE